MKTQLFSFGFKHGPPEADVIWDVRFLPNPHYVPELKEHTGLVSEVSGYVIDNSTAKRFFRHFEPLLYNYVESFADSGREVLRIGIGCTGGRHRSVAVVERLAGFLEENLIDVDRFHRDIEKR